MKIEESGNTQKKRVCSDALKRWKERKRSYCFFVSSSSLQPNRRYPPLVPLAVDVHELGDVLTPPVALNSIACVDDLRPLRKEGLKEEGCFSAELYPLALSASQSRDFIVSGHQLLTV
jgi:hypothetical protein